jgi:triacylglycerol lipase
VLATSVPPSSAIEERAAKLSADIAALAESSESPTVNIIAHSMGGLDARHMIAHCPPPGVRIASLVTVASPHRGSTFADFLLPEGYDHNASSASSSSSTSAADGEQPQLPLIHLSRLYGLLERAGLGTTAFGQLTTRYMTQTFNPSTPDRHDVRYFSFGAACPCPPLLSPFRHSWHIIRDAEGSNDGLVSVDSSRWGDYRGTLMGVSHLDLINWSNKVRWTLREWMGIRKPFNAIAFYLDIADMLAKEGL